MINERRKADPRPTLEKKKEKEGRKRNEGRMK